MAQTVVQFTGVSSGNAANASRTFVSSTTSGNAIYVVLSDYRSAGTITCADNKGNSFSQAVTRVGSDPASNITVFYAENITGGASHQITCTITSSAFFTFAIIEVASSLTAASLDRTTSAAGTSTTPSTGNTAVTSQADEILIGGMTQNSGVVTLSAGTNYTQFYEEEDWNSFQPLHAEYRIVSSAAAYAATWTTGSSADWAAVIATFKAAGGGGGAATSRPPFRRRTRFHTRRF